MNKTIIDKDTFYERLSDLESENYSEGMNDAKGYIVRGLRRANMAEAADYIESSEFSDFVRQEFIEEFEALNPQLQEEIRSSIDEVRR